VWLREKFSAEREQPLAPSVLDALAGHADARGATLADDRVFRTRAGRPISRRHYETLFVRARSGLDWAQRIPVSAHALRHTAITAVARAAGDPVAQAFAGHSAPSVTGRYMEVNVTEIAAAVAILTGEPHPLSTRRRHHDHTTPDLPQASETLTDPHAWPRRPLSARPRQLQLTTWLGRGSLDRPNREEARTCG